VYTVAWGNCLGMVCNDNKEMKILTVGAFIEGDLHLFINATFS
jgi:hypothetical protein